MNPLLSAMKRSVLCVAALALLFGGVGQARAGLITGVHFGNNGAARTNWTLISTTTSPVNNLINESGTPTGVSLHSAGPTKVSTVAL